MKLLSLDITQSAKLAQLFNVLLSIGTTFFLLKTCNLINPSSFSLKLSTLIFLGILPIYYKTFALFRGESFVVFFAILSAYYALLIFVKQIPKFSYAIILGIALGLAGLSRQWGLLLIPAIAIVMIVIALKVRQNIHKFIMAFVVSLVTIILICGWFYLTLHTHYGSITAINRDPQPNFAFSNQPVDFYFGLGLNQLFTKPIRSAFPNELLPIFYSEIWGDYWCFFVVYGKDMRTDEWLSGPQIPQIPEKVPTPDWLLTNRDKMGKYLGRVNLIALFPTMLALIAICQGFVGSWRFMKKPEIDIKTGSQYLLTLLIAVSYIGYFWFLIMYPSPGKGDTIKATYMLHTFPFVAILVGLTMHHINQNSPKFYRLLLIILGIIFLHNLPVFFTRYVMF